SSVCGLFGIKPTRGRVSQGPLNPDLAGLSTNGPLARSVADAALLLDAMTGNFPGDMYTLPPPPAGESFREAARREPGKLRIGPLVAALVEGRGVPPGRVAGQEEARPLVGRLGPGVEDGTVPFGPDVVPFFEALWYGMSTLAPIEEAREGELLPLT